MQNLGRHKTHPEENLQPVKDDEQNDSDDGYDSEDDQEEEKYEGPHHWLIHSIMSTFCYRTADNATRYRDDQKR